MNETKWSGGHEKRAVRGGSDATMSRIIADRMRSVVRTRTCGRPVPSDPDLLYGNCWRCTQTALHRPLGPRRRRAPLKTIGNNVTIACSGEETSQKHPSRCVVPWPGAEPGHLAQESAPHWVARPRHRIRPRGALHACAYHALQNRKNLGRVPAERSTLAMRLLAWTRVLITARAANAVYGRFSTHRDEGSISRFSTLFSPFSLDGALTASTNGVTGITH